MSITELIPEYMETQKKLEERIALLQEQYRMPLGDEAAAVRRRIEVLLDELYETRLVIKHLLSYQAVEEERNGRTKKDAVPA